MQTPATPKWPPSHLAVNSARAAAGSEMVGAWAATRKEIVCERQTVVPCTHLFRSCRAHQKKDPNQGSQKAPIYEGTSGHAQCVPGGVAKNRAIFRHHFSTPVNDGGPRPSHQDMFGRTAVHFHVAGPTNLSTPNDGFRPFARPPCQPLELLMVHMIPKQAQQTMRQRAAMTAHAQACRHDAFHAHRCYNYCRGQAFQDVFFPARYLGHHITHQLHPPSHQDAVDMAPWTRGPRTRGRACHAIPNACHMNE